MPNHKAEGIKGEKIKSQPPMHKCRVYSWGEGEVVSLFSLNSGTGMSGLSPPPTFFPNLLADLLPLLKNPHHFIDTSV